MIRASLVTVFAAILAMLCWESASNRDASVPSAPIAWSSPAEARNRALAFAHAGELDAAIQSAQRYVASDPLVADALSLLGTLQLQQGDAAAADAAFRIAGGLGWRDLSTQLYWLAVAVDLGDLTVAAQRLDAIRRTERSAPPVDQFQAQLESSDTGRAALAEQMASSPKWAIEQAVALRDLSGTSFENRLLLIEAALGAGMSADCRTLAPTARRLYVAGDADRAVRIWPSRCTAALAMDQVRNGAFDRPTSRDNDDPFRWAFDDAEEGGQPIARAPGPLEGTALRLVGGRPATVARQLLTLSPGAHRLSWKMAGVDGGMSGLSNLVTLRCLGSNGALGSRPSADVQRIGVNDFTVPMRNCAMQEVGIGAGPLAPQQSVWIDDLAVAKPASAGL